MENLSNKRLIPNKPDKPLKRGYQWVLIKAHMNVNPKTGVKEWRDAFWQQRKKHISKPKSKIVMAPKAVKPVSEVNKALGNRTIDERIVNLRHGIYQKALEEERDFWKQAYFDSLEVINTLNKSTL